MRHGKRRRRREKIRLQRDIKFFPGKVVNVNIATNLGYAGSDTRFTQDQDTQFTQDHE